MSWPWDIEFTITFVICNVAFWAMFYFFVWYSRDY